MKGYTDLAHDAFQYVELHIAFIIKYKGYTGSVKYSKEDSCLVGTVLDIKDHLGYHGKSIQEVKKAFANCIDEYIEMQKAAK